MEYTEKMGFKKSAQNKHMQAQFSSVEWQNWGVQTKMDFVDWNQMGKPTVRAQTRFSQRRGKWNP